MRTIGFAGLIIGVSVLLAAVPRAAWAQTRDTMQLTDTPGNWFRSALTRLTAGAAITDERDLFCRVE